MASGYQFNATGNADLSEEDIRFFIRQLESTGRYSVQPSHQVQFGTPTPEREVLRRTSVPHTVVSTAVGRPIPSSSFHPSYFSRGPTQYSRPSSPPLNLSAPPLLSRPYTCHSTPAEPPVQDSVPPPIPPPPRDYSSFMRAAALDPFSTKVPKLPSFSGENATGEVDFETWKFDVNCLLREGVYRQHAILEAIRRSLLGKARRALVNLGEFASVSDVVQRLEGIYGNVLTPEKVKEELYSAAQRDGESLADFSIRLEQLFSRAELSASSSSRDIILCERLWSGIRDQNLRNLSRYKYEAIKDFNLLRKELRLLEKDLQLSDSSASSFHAQVPQPTVTPVSSSTSGLAASQNVASADSQILKELKNLTLQLQSLETRFSGMEKDLQGLKKSNWRSNSNKAPKEPLNGETPRS